MPKTADLLEEIAALKAMLIAAEARDKRKDERIARLERLSAISLGVMPRRVPLIRTRVFSSPWPR